MPLSMADIGQKVRVKTVPNDYSLDTHLEALGFTEGVELEVVSNDLCGPFIVTLDGNRLLIGHEAAGKIEVI